MLSNKLCFIYVIASSEMTEQYCIIVFSIFNKIVYHRSGNKIILP